MLLFFVRKLFGSVNTSATLIWVGHLRTENYNVRTLRNKICSIFLLKTIKMSNRCLCSLELYFDTFVWNLFDLVYSKLSPAQSPF